jgi:hypothetical protein
MSFFAGEIFMIGQSAFLLKSKAHFFKAMAGTEDLLLVGTCGALVPELQLGDWVSDFEISGTRCGRIASVKKPVTDPKQKSALALKGYIAVEMEAQALADLGLKLKVLKVVSDLSNQELPPFEQAYKESGEYDRAAIRKILALNPQASALARQGFDTALKALESGIVDKLKMMGA